IAAAPEPDRWVVAQWDGNARDFYVGMLTITTGKKASVLATITQWFQKNRVNLASLNMAQLDEDHNIRTISAAVAVRGREHLNKIMHELRKIDGVIRVEES
ncbi:MAG: hypothetical protein LBB67_03060, partial [Oscillospiraceae bacterium]|nr:hypothetical protein [Oscillospiraceae bacterium]